MRLLLMLSVNQAKGKINSCSRGWEKSTNIIRDNKQRLREKAHDF